MLLCAYLKMYPFWVQFKIRIMHICEGEKIDSMASFKELHS